MNNMKMLLINRISRLAILLLIFGHPPSFAQDAPPDNAVPPEQQKVESNDSNSGATEIETPDSNTTDSTKDSSTANSATPDSSTKDSSPANGGTNDSSTANSSGTAAVATVTTAQLLAMINRQQTQLDDQKQQIEQQNQTIQKFHTEGTDSLQSDREMIEKQSQQIDSQQQTIVAMQTQIDQVSQKKAAEMSEDEIKLRARLETLESSIAASRDAANTGFDEDSFPNSTMIPGTNAAWRMGGFVKMNIVETFDPLGSLDRFIAGSIPVPQESTSPRTSMTVSQSRLNWDLRDKTQYGTMRAYIEGDFAGSDDSGTDDTFRLRHAFGQFKDVLAGKTWSVFQDIDAAPEEIDFEGINGAINVRQAQIRYSPKIGQDWDLMFSLEDPNPEVTGGTATSQIPDLVASARRTWFDRWHIRTSAVLRQITATWDLDSESESKVTGWGLSLSGKTATRFWNSSGDDNLMFQINVGKGIGRYINDLNTLGGQDAIFDQSGSLHTLPTFAGYVAYQHWWSEAARSTLNLSWVDVDNLDFEPDRAYHKTFRGALNYIYSPTARIDLGAEVIWGQRTNNNNDKASAAQIQLSTKYRF